MRTATSPSTSLGLTLLAVLAGAVLAPAPLQVAHAAPPEASASAASSPPASAAPSAGASPSASASAEVWSGKPSVMLSAYAWPTEATPEPKDEEWAGATDLGIMTPNPRYRWARGLRDLKCEQRALGSWMRITCTPPHDSSDDTLVGVIWGMAGDLGKVKGRFVLASELERYKKPTTDVIEALTRKMGASATITFPITPGGALVLGLDRIGWDQGYEGSNVFSQFGILIDVSWALGEKAPTIMYN